jgi:hypothetical protein
MLRKPPRDPHLRPTSSTQQRAWSSSSIWRGWQGRATTWPHTRVGCTQLRLGTPPLPSPQPVSQSELLPPLVKMLCCKSGCQRCAAHLGRFKFPWLSSFHPMCGLGTLWDAWTYYEHQEKMDLLLLAAWLFEAWREQCFLERGFRIELGARSGGGSGRPSCG